jgi:uncharacterized protein (TIGR03067 family)
MLRRVLFLCAAFYFVPALAVAEKPSPKNTEKDLQGTWQAVDGEANGQEVADDKVQETHILIEADRLEIKPDGEGRKTTFKVDPGKTPRTIDLTPVDGGRKGTVVPGIYSLQDGQLRLCVNIWGKDPAQRPNEFKTQPGDGYVFITLKRTTQK